MVLKMAYYVKYFLLEYKINLLMQEQAWIFLKVSCDMYEQGHFGFLRLYCSPLVAIKWQFLTLPVTVYTDGFFMELSCWQ